MTYESAIAELYRLDAKLGWDLKLERVRAALLALGSPEQTFPAVLIAGTNGKGSTAALTEAALRAAGHRVGLYTSPHLVHFTERIRVHGREVARAQVLDGLARIYAAANPERTGLTFFEVATLLALLVFAEERIDVAVLEVGLGGRLDATNVVEPIASAIVSIGFDHETFLGHTLDAIAREKAGVMRAGRATVIGPAMPPEALAALVDEGARRGARLHEVGDLDRAVPPVSLRGAHMRANAATARLLLEALAAARPELRVDETALCRGFAAARWPGRLDLIRSAPLVLCDGAHNREAAQALASSLPEIVGEQPVRLMFAALSDKPWRDMARTLLPHACAATVVSLASPRAVAPEELRGAFADLPTRTSNSAAEALRQMIAEDPVTPILVSGSLFLVGEILAEELRRTGAQSVLDLRAEVRS